MYSGPADIAEWQGPELSLQDCAGEARALESWSGTRGLVVAIGASWCGPCQDDAPLLQAFAGANPDLGVVQVLVEDAAAAPATHLACDEWTEAFSLSYPVLIDPVFLTEALVRDSGFPVHVAFDPAGSEVYWEAGPFDGAAVLAAAR